MMLLAWDLLPGVAEKTSDDRVKTKNRVDACMESLHDQGSGRQILIHSLNLHGSP